MEAFVIIYPFVAGCIISAMAVGMLIPKLREWAGQNIREDGPQAHLKKQGTPSMGGIGIIAGTLIAAVLLALSDGTWCFEIGLSVVGFIGYGLIGFIDDYEKIAHKQNLGLRAWQKLVIQIALGLVIAILMAKFSHHGTCVYFPIVEKNIDFGIFYVPFITFTLVAMSNSVNLTDGLDGLAGGVTCIVALFFAVAAYLVSETVSITFFSALSGACLGFLVYNHHPAKVFMGDTGSMALGGGLAVAAIACNLTIFLPFAGLIYVLEALSVIIQVISFKTTGKRVFKMAPLHHHFELCGLEETKVVIMFWFGALICCVACLGALQ